MSAPGAGPGADCAIVIEDGAGVLNVHSSLSYARGCRTLREEGWVFVEFGRNNVDADILETLKTETGKDVAEDEDTEVMRLDYCRATLTIAEVRSAGALGNYDRGQGGECGAVVNVGGALVSRRGLRWYRLRIYAKRLRGVRRRQNG